MPSPRPLWGVDYQLGCHKVHIGYPQGYDIVGAEHAHALVILRRMVARAVK